MNEDNTHPASGTDTATGQRKRGRPRGSRNGKATGREANSTTRTSSANASSSRTVVPSIQMLTAEDFVPDMSQLINMTPSAATLRSLNSSTLAEMNQTLNGGIVDEPSPSNGSAISNSTSNLRTTTPSAKPKIQVTLHAQRSSFVIDHDEWYTSTNEKCWNCRQPIDGIPMRHCKTRGYCRLRKKFIVDGLYGWFHHLPCLRAYLESTNVPNIGHELLVASDLATLLGLPMTQTCGVAPPWQAHIGNGGFMTDEEYHKACFSTTRVSMLPDKMLIPAPIVAEMTRLENEEDPSKCVDELSSVFVDEASGILMDADVDLMAESSHRSDRELSWKKFKATGFSFQKEYIRS